MKKIIVFCSLIFAFNAAAYCGQPSRVELNDGSVINGEITSFADNVYTVNTANLQEVKINAADITKIEPLNYAPAGVTSNSVAQAAGLTPSASAAYGQMLMGNPENMNVIMGLTNNPDLQAIAQDPDILDAARRNDVQALMKNEKFMKVVNSPEVEEAVKKIKK